MLRLGRFKRRLTRLTRRGRSRFRQVTFASRRSRTVWGGLGLVLAVVGGWLVLPALRSNPEPPHPWGLWITTNARDKATYPSRTSWLLKLSLKAEEGCGRPVTARGELQVASPYKLARSPTMVALAVANARVLGAEVKGIQLLRRGRLERWRPMKVSRFHGTYVVHGRLNGYIERNLLSPRVLIFRLFLDLTRRAGYSACYMTSPALFGLAGNMLWQRASADGEEYFRRRTRVAYWPLRDAIVHMSVPGRLPDRTVLDANARVRGDSLQLTCRGSLPVSRKRVEEDEYYHALALAEEPSCASVQTFRAGDASEDLNRRLFLAGFLFSAAFGMLLEALATGQTDRVSRRQH